MIDQNILLQVQDKQISTGRAKELLEEEASQQQTNKIKEILDKVEDFIIKEFITQLKQPDKIDEYKCDMCGGIFKKGWSEEEANQEAEDIWGVKNANEDKDMAIVCDDCWNKIN